LSAHTSPSNTKQSPPSYDDPSPSIIHHPTNSVPPTPLLPPTIRQQKQLQLQPQIVPFMPPLVVTNSIVIDSYLLGVAFAQPIEPILQSDPKTVTWDP
jgi:hypothetical protein